MLDWDEIDLHAQVMLQRVPKFREINAARVRQVPTWKRSEEGRQQAGAWFADTALYYLLTSKPDKDRLMRDTMKVIDTADPIIIRAFFNTLQLAMNRGMQ